MKVYPFIAAEKAAGRHTAPACRLLSVSRSAYYQWSSSTGSQHAQKDGELRNQIRAIHSASRGTYGSPRIHQQLRKDGVCTARKRVARLMAAQGLHGRQRRRFLKTTIADPATTPVATDLLQRQFEPAAQALDTVWVGDITYIRTWQGWAYLATVIDLASRRVVGWTVADHMRTQLVADALEMALKGRRPVPGLIFHSDRGSQYTSLAFRQLIASHHLQQSLSRPRQCWDNAVAESFFATLKTELVHRASYTTVAAARSSVFEYIEVFYNRQRIHSALGYQSPAAYEASRLQPPPSAVSAA